MLHAFWAVGGVATSILQLPLFDVVAVAITQHWALLLLLLFLNEENRTNMQAPVPIF